MHLIAHLVVHLSNQMFVGRIQMQTFKVRIQMQMHYKFYGGILMRIQMPNIQIRIQMHLHLLTSLAPPEYTTSADSFCCCWLNMSCLCSDMAGWSTMWEVESSTTTVASDKVKA